MEILNIQSKPIPYQKMYTTLFNAITDALELMEKGSPAEAAPLLKRAQQDTEEQYMEAGEKPIPLRRGIVDAAHSQ